MSAILRWFAARWVVTCRHEHMRAVEFFLDNPEIRYCIRCGKLEVRTIIGPSAVRVTTMEPKP